MTLTLDGFEMLRRIGSNGVRFPVLEPKVAVLAEKLIKGELTSRAIDPRAFSALVEALGADAVGLVIETMKPAELKRLRSALSPATGRAKGLSKAARALLSRIAAGSLDPNAAPAGPQRGRKLTARRKTGAAALGTAAMRASR